MEAALKNQPLAEQSEEQLARVATHPNRTSHNLMVWSREHETKVSPAGGTQATQDTLWSCPLKVLRHSAPPAPPSEKFQIFSRSNEHRSPPRQAPTEPCDGMRCHTVPEAAPRESSPVWRRQRQNTERVQQYQWKARCRGHVDRRE